MSEERSDNDGNIDKNRSVMNKEMEIKEDGRILYFYSFTPASKKRSEKAVDAERTKK